MNSIGVHLKSEFWFLLQKFNDSLQKISYSVRTTEKALKVNKSSEVKPENVKLLKVQWTCHDDLTEKYTIWISPETEVKETKIMCIVCRANFSRETEVSKMSVIHEKKDNLVDSECTSQTRGSPSYLGEVRNAYVNLRCYLLSRAYVVNIMIF
jgi:uncharacterized CHY-type Zn-finger protein